VQHYTSKWQDGQGPWTEMVQGAGQSVKRVSVLPVVPFFYDPGPMDKVNVFCYNLLIHKVHTRVATCNKAERFSNG
jgi:hypothetical protein